MRQRFGPIGALFGVGCLTARAQFSSYAPECSLCPLPDHFATIDLDEAANHTTIKKQCRLMRAKTHPDKNPSPEAKEQHLAVNEACEVLGRRRRRDDHSHDLADGDDIDTYDDYVSKRSICKKCQSSNLGSFNDLFGWPFDAAAQQAAHGDFGQAWGADAWNSLFTNPFASESTSYERFERSGRPYMREIRCPQGLDRGRCFAQDYMEVHDRASGQPSYYPDGDPYSYDPPSQGQGGHSSGDFDPTLLPNEFLKAGAWLTSADGSHFAVLTLEGNFAIYEGAHPNDALGQDPIWETATHASGGEPFVMLQPDGGLGLFLGSQPGVIETVLWYSGKSAEPHLEKRVFGRLEDDGNLVIYGESTDEIDCLWASVACPNDGNPLGMWRRLKHGWRLSTRRIFRESSHRTAGRHKPVLHPVLDWLKSGFRSVWAWVGARKKQWEGARA